jgi:SAM-dependent methyltransferase
MDVLNSPCRLIQEMDCGKFMKLHKIGEHTIPLSPIESDGFILDIGGGGEGVIGRLAGRQVVAIDISARELLEVKNASQKIAADARGLCFPSSSFGVATSFFSLMYIMTIDHESVFREIHSVLKDRGRFLLWDVKIPARGIDADAFIVPLKVILPEEELKTSYGVKWDSTKKQDLAHFKELAHRTDFKYGNSWRDQEVFYLELIKESKT